MKPYAVRTALVLAIVLAASAIPRPQQPAAASQRFPQFDNADVKVWKSVIVPSAPLTLHRHEHPRVIIALRGGTIRIVEQDGKFDQQVWETGKAYWLPANPPGTMHTDSNVGKEPTEVMVVELLHEK